MICEIINMSDPYTLKCDDFNLGVAAVCLLGNGNYGLRALDNSDHTPVLFGWQSWLAERHLNLDEFIPAHMNEIADVLDTVLIGDPGFRADADEAMQRMPEAERETWRAARHDRHRSSMNDIGTRALQLAKQLRARAEAKAP